MVAGGVLLAACGSEAPLPLPDGGSGAPADGGVAGSLDAGPDPSEVMFDPARLLEVDIELLPADWDALRRQTRDLADTLGRPECLAAPFPSPFTYFPARVTVDGVAVENSAVRKKGFLGSLSEQKPSLKISFDEYVPGRELNGVDGLTLNNGRQDPSLIKACLGYLLFREAGLPASRCTFAKVTVNGELLGVYANVEAIKKRFLRRHFASDEGNLYEGTLSDFRDGWLGTFEQKTNVEVPSDGSDLLAMTAALQVSDAELGAALEPILDVDAFLTFWATEVLIQHWDGYAGNTNNFYLYRDPATARLHFLPWGVDGILGARPGAGLPQSVYATGLLARRLYLHPELGARYVERLGELLDSVFDAPALIDEVDRIEALIVPAVSPAERVEVTTAIEALRTFLRGREDALRRELRAGRAAWDVPLRDPPCFRDVGALHARLETRWGTHPTNNPFNTGTGTLTGTVAGVALEPMQVGSAAGFGQNPDDAGQVALVLAATLPGGAIAVVYAVIDPVQFVPGTLLPIDQERARGVLARIPRAGAPLELVAYFSQGSVRIDAASLVDGAPVDVTLDAVLWAPAGL